MLRTGIATLDRSANRRDRTGFVLTVGALDWTQLSAEELNAAMENALTLEALPLARRLAECGQQRFPEDSRFPELLRLTAPAKLVGTSPASGGGPGAEATRRWLRENQHRYPGKWIAVKDGVLRGAEDELSTLRATIEAAGARGAFVVRVLSS